MIECVRCGKTFKPRRKNQTYCRKDCGRYSGPATFVALDGEGVTTKLFGLDVHDYVLLSVGDESLYHPLKETQIPPFTPLKFKEILAFLWEQYLDAPDSVYVGFYLNYDFTMWLKSLPADRAFKLLHPNGIKARQRKDSGGNPTPFPVDLGEWEFDMLPNMKRFKLRRKGSKRWMYVCDTGAFFQTSLLRALDSKNRKAPLIPDDELAVISEGKLKRTDAMLGPDMIRYNLAENRALIALMNELQDGLLAMDLKLRRNQWFGPGQAAQAWLNKINAPTKKDHAENIPQHVLDAARGTYFGGWFEITCHGPRDTLVHEYDINSAYPSIIQRLPCFQCNKWYGGTGNIPDGLSPVLVYATVHGSHPDLGVMSHRTPDGKVSRPHNTKGWFILSELLASCGAGLVDHYAIEQWVGYDPCDCPSPFRAIGDLYQKRLDIGKNSPVGIAAKLVYNSVYGKLAQSMGSPKYGCSLYASMITSGCRQLILEAMASIPNGASHVTMVATDAIYTDVPLVLELSDTALGGWSYTPREGLSQLMPGIYWDRKVIDGLKDGLELKYKSRGVNPRYLLPHLGSLDEQWLAWEGPGHPFPSVEIIMGFLISTPKQALQRGNWKLCGKMTQNPIRKISADWATKRSPKLWHPSYDGHPIRSYPYDQMGTLESTAYDKRFGQELLNDLATSPDPIDTMLDMLESGMIG